MFDIQGRGAPRSTRLVGYRQAMQGQGLQVPTWLGVLLVLAVPAGTVFGAWLGQKTSSKRDDARWDRERDREEVRWKRELEREELRWQREVTRANEQRRHELGLNLRERLLVAYQDFLAAYDKMHGAASMLALKERDDASAVEPLKRFEESFENALHAMDSLRIIADADVYQKCFESLDLLSSPQYKSDNTESASKYLQKLVLQRESLYTLIRTELGVTNPEWRLGLRQKPTSEPTSDL